MTMAFGSFNQSGNTPLMAEINMVPLIDVMLVLLVIFIVTAPLLTHAVKIDLPKAASSPNQTKPDSIQFAIDADASLYWNGEAIDRPEMIRRLAAAGKVSPQPELHLRVEKTTQYQAVADIMSEAAKAGLVKIGFVTDPAKQQR